jgi:hypothetical protein
MIEKIGEDPNPRKIIEFVLFYSKYLQDNIMG